MFQQGIACAPQGMLTFAVLRGVHVAGERVLQLVTRLVEDAEVVPGGEVVLLQLHGTDVRLQCVHRLTLLLVEHPASQPCTAVTRAVSHTHAQHAGLPQCHQLIMKCQIHTSVCVTFRSAMSDQWPVYNCCGDMAYGLNEGTRIL